MKKPTTTTALAKPSSFFFGTKVIRVEGDLVCLTDMWKASDEEAVKAPYEWQRLPSYGRFISALETDTGKSRDELFRVVREGPNKSTWAHWQIGLAYAKYLSPAFHIRCNEVFQAYRDGGLIDRAVVDGFLERLEEEASLRPIDRATVAMRSLELKRDLQREKLEHEKKKLAAKMLGAFSATLRANNQNDLAQTIDVKAIEFMTGDKYAFALPANTTADWQSPTQIAEATGATPNLVGRVISSLGLRGDIEGTCRPLLGTAKEGTKTVPVFIYSPEAVKQITTAVRARMAPKAS